jgi:hypothetical protein
LALGRPCRRETPAKFLPSINLAPTKAAHAQQGGSRALVAQDAGFLDDLSNLLAPFLLWLLTIYSVWILFTLFDRLFGIRHQLVLDIARGST